MEINRENIKEIIEKCGAQPDKDYGQNFLIEPSISSKIVDSLDLCNSDSVLEIGPGLGSLTHFLNLKTDNLTVVDIDRRMCEFIATIYPQINIINDDIRKVDVSNYDYILGNLPYNITTELVEYLLINSNNAKKLILMCQLEAFSRFSDLSGEAYGPLSILLHLLGNCKKLFVVKKGSFLPVPKCNSVVFEISLNSVSNEDKKTYLGVYKFAKQMFLSRRKTILNNLSNYLSDRNTSADILKSLNIDPLTRPEQISFTKYLDLYKKIK